MTVGVVQARRLARTSNANWTLRSIGESGGRRLELFVMSLVANLFIEDLEKQDLFQLMNLIFFHYLQDISEHL